MSNDFTVDNFNNMIDFKKFIKAVKNSKEKYLTLVASRKVEGMMESRIITKERLYAVIIIDVSSYMNKNVVSEVAYFIYKNLVKSNNRKIKIDLIVFAETAEVLKKIKLNNATNVLSMIETIDVGKEPRWPEAHKKYKKLTKWSKVNGVAVVSNYQFNDKETKENRIKWGNLTSLKTPLLNIFIANSLEQSKENFKVYDQLPQKGNSFKCIYQQNSL